MPLGLPTTGTTMESEMQGRREDSRVMNLRALMKQSHRMTRTRVADHVSDAC